MDSIARKVAANVREMAPGRFTARAATPQTYPHIAWRDYDRTRGRLQALGFSYLGDIEPLDLVVDPTMSRSNVMRVMSGDGGSIMAVFYRIPLRWTLRGILGRFFGGSGLFVDLETLFPDGTVLATSTAGNAGVWTPPPFLNREFLPRSTSVDTLLARHRERLRARAGAQPVPVRTLAEVIAATDATERAKRAHRQALGWITRDELSALSRLSGARLDQLEQAVRAALLSTA
jgi:hypothetical protein